jgi:hypothetical protein
MRSQIREALSFIEVFTRSLLGFKDKEAQMSKLFPDPRVPIDEAVRIARQAVINPLQVQSARLDFADSLYAPGI